MKNKRVFYLILPIAALILELLPFGAVCNFARPESDGTIGNLRELYSYFDLIPVGYANFAPFLTALVTCIVLLLTVIYCLKDVSGLLNILKGALIVAVVLSLCPLIYGIRYFSVVGALITAVLLAQLLLLHFTAKKN